MAPLSTGALVVFALVAAALALFVTEWLPPDMTAVAVLVALVVLEPYTGVPARTAIDGFASPAVVTIVAMYILSAGVESAGVVDWLAGRLAALDLLPIYIAALGGVVATVATGTLSASQAYDAVSWNVVFLLAGLLPLGQAMQATGGAAFVGALLVDAAGVLPPLALLALVYLLTAVLASVITPPATVVLMIPIAVATAAEIGVSGFPFLVVVTFAVATAFLTPIGYQTNLMVYGPGGYRFTDFARVGGPLQLLLCAVTTLSVSVVWPL
ncbi:SLC13 family permease [Haloarcula sp. Atlit-120R]|uniref:SLC13 family permease n=1 Tax=Haloarcula sp. Atlit-120R TaxID=2282135 RepID=UPI000EF24652|nr:SLC13 family permease [Haloarcula sp. Atlit-120R]RLM36811.1 hypothetical protein DVK01_09335 [Haloarcula sp. Atlit-120R]